MPGADPEGQDVYLYPVLAYVTILYSRHGNGQVIGHQAEESATRKVCLCRVTRVVASLPAIVNCTITPTQPATPYQRESFGELRSLLNDFDL